MFRHINSGLADRTKQILADCAKKVNLNVSDLTVGIHPVNSFEASFNFSNNTLEIGRLLETRLSDQDLAFVILHELRHAHQYNEAIVKTVFHKETWCAQWKDETPVPFSYVGWLLGCSTSQYSQLPWEADANGFAHHIMGNYVPENAALATGVKFSTTPAEFLYKQYA